MSQRIPSTISRRRWDGSSDLGARVLPTIRETRTAPRPKAIAFTPNGNAMPTANRNAPNGGVRSWFTRRSAAFWRALAMPRSSAATRLGMSVLLAASAKVSAVPSTNSVTRTMAMLTTPLTIITVSSTRTRARKVFTPATILLMRATGPDTGRTIPAGRRSAGSDDYDPAMPRIPGLGDDAEFLKLWTGGFVSTIGFHVSILAMQLTAAAVLHASPVEMGLLGAAQFIPRLAFGLVAGVWVDRLRRRPLMIVADLGRALLLASVPVAFALGVLAIPQLYVVALGVGTFSVFFGVASQAYIPALVGRERIVDANARMSAGEAVAQIAGPNVAGVLVQILTAPIAIGVDALSYLVSALSIAWIRRPEPPVASRAERRHVVAEIREGLSAVAASPVLRALVAAAVNIGFFTGGVRGALIVLYLVQLGVTPIEFG